MKSQLLFSEYFGISSSVMDHEGLLDICIEADLPLFIDPFLLFASEKPEYQVLHDAIVGHLIHLKQIAIANPRTDIRNFQFPEIKQNWLGFSKWGNNGRGLGPQFARDLIKAFNGFYKSFGRETLTSSSHIEKLTLLGSGIGRDFISDFTTNLMQEHLLGVTERFSSKHLKPHQLKQFTVRCSFNQQFGTWQPRTFTLPYFYRGDKDGDFILLTPTDILSKDEAFISHSDFVSRFRHIANSLSNESLRSSINEYFVKRLPSKASKEDLSRAIRETVAEYPELLDYYIQLQENNRDAAARISGEKIDQLKKELLAGIASLFEAMMAHGKFYTIPPSTSYEDALKRVSFLKDVIENNDGYRIFYNGTKPANEDTIQRIFRLTWFASPMDINAEVNNGRGPADYKISYGDRDSTIVEFKLGSSTSLERNLKNQTAIYKAASRSPNDIKVILCYTKAEIAKVQRILKKIGQDESENVVIIDATKKASASKQS